MFFDNNLLKLLTKINGGIMSNFRVLMLYPNLQNEMLVPPVLALFSALLKREGFTVELFDTTNYKIETDFVDSDKVKMRNLNVRPYQQRVNFKTSDPYKDWRDTVESFGPDLILVSVTENMFPMAVNLLKYVDDLGVPVVMGGVFTTFAPELAMRWKEIDIICVGEGEHALVELCKKMSHGENFSKIPGLWVRQNNGDIIKNPVGKLVDMNENPLPDFTIFEDARFYRPMAGSVYRMFPIETHRGCPYTCSFCNSPSQNQLFKSSLNVSFFRKSSLEKIREELMFCRDTWDAEYFLFWADTFFAWSDKEFYDFCDMYEDIKIPFWCQTRPETVVEPRIKRLKEVGVQRMDFGIEHGNPEYRKRVIKRNYSNELVLERMKIVSDYNVQYAVNNILGFPYETRELAFDTIELNRGVKSDTLDCSVFVPYNGTELRTVCQNAGFIHPDAICRSNSDDSALTMPPPFLSKEEVRRLRDVFTMYVKFPKDRWPEIQLAEQKTPEGDKIRERLREEYIATFFATTGDMGNVHAGGVT